MLAAVALVIGVVLVLGRASRMDDTYAPTKAELEHPDRARLLVGEWVWTGSISDDTYRPPAVTDQVLAFRPDGTLFLLDDSAESPWRWAIVQGSLELSRDGGTSLLTFFFRDGRLYLEEDDGDWSVYRRR
ncbi:MAG: hypothetical protein ABFC80_02160 [Coriobacteriales bacterium]